MCRTEHELTDSVRTKVARFCNVAPSAVIQSIDAETIYDVPLLLMEERLDQVVLEKLGMAAADEAPDLESWKNSSPNTSTQVDRKVGLVGKYVELKDSYKSIIEALIHAGAHQEVDVQVDWIHSESITSSATEKLGGLDGIIVALASAQGVDGKIETIQYARTAGIPFFGMLGHAMRRH